MIPGEMLIDDGEIELNAGRDTIVVEVAKDCAAAAVLVVALGAVAVGVAIFLPRLLGG